MSIPIRNIDPQGNEIININWEEWERVQVDEVLDNEGKVIECISHCIPLTQEEN